MIFWLGFIFFAKANEPIPSELSDALDSAENAEKDLMILVLGPNSNPQCKIFNEVVLKGIRPELSEKFVILEIPGYSKNGSQVGENAKGSEGKGSELIQHFKVQSYPLLLLTTSDGKVYSKRSLHVVKEDQFRKILSDELPKREAQRRAYGIRNQLSYEDTEQSARDLSKWLNELLPEVVILNNWELVEHISKLDPGGKTGEFANWERKKYEFLTVASFNRIYHSISAELRKIEAPKEAVAFLDQVIAEQKLDKSMEQLMGFQKFRIWIQAGDAVNARNSLVEAIELVPDTPAAKNFLGLVEKLDEGLAKMKAGAEPEVEGEVAPQRGAED